jgi:hypothetical protein
MKYKGTEAGVYSLGQYTIVFQAEEYAINACAVQNLDRNCRHRNIYNLSDSRAAIKALRKYQITLKLVRNWLHVTEFN